MADRARTLSAPAAGMDDTTKAAFDAAVADAYARGLVDGRREGLEAAVLDHAQAAAAVTSAIADAGATLLQRRGEQAEAVTTLAAAISRALLGREPHDGGRALLSRVRAALEAIDDGPLVVHVNAEDCEILRGGLAGLDLEVTTDPSLAPGEAKVVGRWATAELTEQTAWDAVQEVLADVAG